MDPHAMSWFRHTNSGARPAHIPTPGRLKLAAGPAYDLSTG